MEMKDLERLIDERSQKQIDDAKESIKKELGAVPQAQIDEAVKKAVAEVTAKADAEKAENVKYLEAFKEAVSKDEKSFVKETKISLIQKHFTLFWIRKPSTLAHLQKVDLQFHSHSQASISMLL